MFARYSARARGIGSDPYNVCVKYDILEELEQVRNCSLTSGSHPAVKQALVRYHDFLRRRIVEERIIFRFDSIRLDVLNFA